MANNKLWCLTTYFNPAKYKSRLRNHLLFTQNLKHNLLTIELAFGDEPFSLEDSVKLRANSVLWQKERMLNYALSLLPPTCEYIAWIDGDVILPDNWVDLAISEFEKGYEVLQLFEQVKHLPPNETSYSGTDIMTERGLVWQSKTYPDFLSLRKKNKILYATTGFAWAAKRSIFSSGFYDKHVLGANDNLIIDCCLNTFELHHYYKAGLGTLLLDDMLKWANTFGSHPVNYLPITIYHLFHGHKKNRGYLTREDIVKKYNYDPSKDIKLVGDVYEWATDKKEFHEEVKNYFSNRQEDSF